MQKPTDEPLPSPTGSTLIHSALPKTRAQLSPRKQKSPRLLEAALTKDASLSSFDLATNPPITRSQKVRRDSLTRAGASSPFSFRNSESAQQSLCESRPAQRRCPRSDRRTLSALVLP